MKVRMAAKAVVSSPASAIPIPGLRMRMQDLAPKDPSSIAWLYHSHLMAEEETNLGLIGTIITRKGKERASDDPTHVNDHMMVGMSTYWHVK